MARHDLRRPVAAHGVAKILFSLFSLMSHNNFYNFATDSRRPAIPERIGME
jgi:hypothetical protein